MARYEDWQRIAGSGVVAVMRGMQARTVEQVARALRAGGIEVLEVTVDSPGALQMLEEVTRALGDEALVGAGTVLDAATARACILAGAEFIFTPALSVEVIETANRYGKVVIPGVMTPTEMLAAFSAGAPAVKVFPAKVLGPDYIRQVRGPLPHIPMIPTGGISAANAGDFIRAGAAAIGVGGALVDGSAIQAGRFEVLTERARALVDVVKAARSELPRG